MDVSPQIALKFHGVDFPVVDFKSDKSLLGINKKDIDINIRPQVFYPEGQPEFFRIIQEIHLASEGYFQLTIVAIGTFELKSNVDDETKKSFVNVNAPAIMFPYIRSFIATFTANLGSIIGTLTIPTQFFKGEIEEYNNSSEN